MLHSIPQAETVIAELARVTRPGGYLHFIVEDYGMLHFATWRTRPERLLARGPRAMERAMNIDLSIGRNTFGILSALGLEQIAIDYIVVNTIRVPARHVCNDYRSLARRLRRRDRRVDVDHPRVCESITSMR